MADALHSDRNAISRVFDRIDDFTGAQSYAEGKWSVKEVLLHCIDAERVFAYRALRFMRGDSTELPGYNHEAFVRESQANMRTCPSLQEEWEAVRFGTIALFRNADLDQLNCRGIANGKVVSVRALGLIIPGHNLHHTAILAERYGIY